MLFQTLDKIFTNGTQVTTHKNLFICSLKNLVKKQKEYELATALKIKMKDDLGKLNYSHKELEENKSNYSPKYHRFYSQNLIIKAFYTLLKYSKKKRELVEARNRLEALVYSMENTLEDQKDKIPEEEKEKVNKLIADANEVKSNEEATKEEIDTKIDEITKEFQELAAKFQAPPSESGGNPADMVEDHHEDGKEEGGEVDWEVIDAE